MKLARVAADGGERLATISREAGTAVLLDPALGTLDDVVRGKGPTLEQLEAAGARGRELPLGDVRLLAPLRRFNRDVLCTGWNYWDHFEESSGKREGQDPDTRPEHPTFFTKGPDTVIGPCDDIAYDAAISTRWDYEAEVALVIGRDGRSIAEADARDHVFGYCLANDVSQRDLQRRHGGQWLKGKSIDSTMPLGPWITTADEVDPADVRVECLLNGEVMQSASMRQMAFGVEQLIAELSFGMTLRAGDVVLTGTPSGIGNAREPAVFLAPGDLVVTRSPQLGELRNRMTPVSLASPHAHAVP